MKGKIRNFFWYAFVFTLPFQTVWILRDVYIEGEKWEYASILFYASDFFLLGFLTFFFLQIPRQKYGIFLKDGVVVSLLGMVIFSLFSCFWALDFSIALFFTWKLFLSLGLFISVRYGDLSFSKTYKTFLVALSIHIFLGLIQWTTQHSPEITFLGLSEYESWKPGVSVLKDESGRWLRSYGGFSHPNIFGGIMAIISLASMCLVLGKEKKYNILWFFLPFSLWGLIFSFSRTTWIGFFFGWLFVMGGIIFWKEYKKFLFRWMFISFIVVCSLGIFFFPVRELFFNRFPVETLAQEKSFVERQELFLQSKELIQKNIWGVGAGNFTMWTKEHVFHKDSYIAQFQPVHNVFLLVFSELGIVGFLFFLMLIGFLFREGIKRRLLFSLGIFCTILPFLFLDHWIWTSHFGIFFSFALIGFFFRSREEKV
ncbi:MAG: O-antigen ligase family protein [Candidatus Moraniibacteriota bacterium]|nr:MAG: O-antigen ligase family protein [Candidatus Moranbacteria bacterium]